jgi:thiol-disulfide isomerase/thioredoxin
MVWATTADATNPTAEQALKLTPVQKGVDYDRPSPEEAARCKIYPKKIDGHVGWIVESAEGTMLRRFIDTNGDNMVDQWSYFKDGVEVYRDIDSNFNGKVDQCRWFNTGGSRWGISKNEDGVIDYWKSISAEEVAAEAIAALASSDVQRFARLLPTAAEIKALGLGETRGAQLREKIARLGEDFVRAAGQQKAIGPAVRDVQFAGSQPGIIPAGSEGSTADVMVYEGVAAVAENDGKHVQVQLGTLVRLGDAWRLIDVPQPVVDGQAENAAPGFFFRTPNSRARGVTAGASDLLNTLMGKLERLDKGAADAKTAEEKAAFNARRADVLEELSEAAGTLQERDMWLRQMVDMISAAVQAGQYPDGLKRLEILYDKLSKRPEQKEATAYVKFRQLFVDYVMKTQAAGADQAKLQEEWQKTLEQFVGTYPQSSETPEAMLQLAMYREYAGQEGEAKRWYGRIITEFAGTPAARKASGAQTRLDAVGKVLSFRGKSPTGEVVDLAKYRGRIVLLQFWSTAHEPCKLDMPVLKELVGKYDSSFTVVSVSLDEKLEELTSYLQSAHLPWAQVYEEGGLESRPANDLGIISLPTMILLDQTGKVVNRNVRVAELEPELKKLTR